MFALLAQTRTTYELSRLQEYTAPWHYLVLTAVCLAIAAFVVWMYRRDSVELRRGAAVVLLVLRLSALAGLLAFYLHLEKRSEQKVVHNSRVLVMVDTSLSMGLQDATGSAEPALPNRLDQVVKVLSEGKLIDDLRQRHDVEIARFDADLTRLAALGKQTAAASAAPSPAPASAPTGPDSKDAVPRNWQSALIPQGIETRLGQSLRTLVHDERSTPVSGIVLFSDGGQNAGIDPQAAIALARDAQIPIFTVGVGSDRRPANVRISDLVAPARAYPGDSFQIMGYLQAEGLADRTVTVELLSRPGTADAADRGSLEAGQRITLGGRGEVVPVKFDITPTEKGRRVYRLRVQAPPEDSHPSDNEQEVDVEIVDRKTRVLLVASGPTREYVFLRNQLKRDREMTIDVWLQSAGEGASQDADRILTAFPATPQEMFEYDCVVAFDPDWRKLDDAQVDLLERWVAEKAGGLIVLAGPVEMDRWVTEPKLSKLRGLYPVEFNRRMTLFEEGRFGSKTPWPIEFTREGLESEFLWLADNAAASRLVWDEFPGVYGYYGVRGPKPGATVYGYYSDPQAGGAERPVYMAGQFYGSGRVFYLGSGEMWRLRALDDKYFEQLYTKLLRHVSQGRLLLGSSRGMLLVDRDRYLLGNTVAVRAQLSDAQFEPLDLPGVTLQVIRPDGTSQALQLAPDAARKGMYAGQFTALAEGTYRLELGVPGGEEEVLSRRIQVRVPDVERESPERNDALLSDVAKRTGGIYYVGADSVLGARGVPPLVKQLRDRTETTYLAGVTDRDFEFNWMRSLLVLIAGALCLEWLIRRLSKLAQHPSMATDVRKTAQLEPALEALLAALRRRIRAYIWADGVAAIMVLLAVAFWVSLAFDWLFEPPAVLRGVTLVALAGAVAYVGYRFLAARLAVRLRNRNLALVLERRFQDLGDSLLTAVELSEQPEHAAEFNAEMLARVHREAQRRTGGVKLAEVLNTRPLVRRISLSAALVAAIAVFAVAAPEALGTWARRSLLLSDELWPRRTHLSVAGFDESRRVKMARGGDWPLVVRADAALGRWIPEVVEVRYSTLEGARGRENMSRAGIVSPGEGPFQPYAYTFRSVLAPLEFYVVGGDDREGPFYLDVVDSPTLSRITLRCEFPPYTRREPREVPGSGLVQLPRGTAITVAAAANKPLVDVQIDDVTEENAPRSRRLDLAAEHGAPQTAFELALDRLDADKTLLFTLTDADGIRSRDAIRLAIAAVADEPPQVNVSLRGIGTAITSAARLPAAGEVSDDYGVAKVWFDFHPDEQPPQQRAIDIEAVDQEQLDVAGALEVRDLELKPKQKLHLAVRAADGCALAGGPNVGASQSYVLDVVTPEQLRSMLEARELQLRRRFETIMGELTETRDLLAATELQSAPQPPADEQDQPEQPAEAADAASPDEPRPRARASVQVERVLQNSERSGHETLQLAQAFDDIREEMINNRIDTEELKTRLKDGVADPLRRIVETRFPPLAAQLKQLAGQLSDPPAATKTQAAAVAQIDAILVEMKAVLDKMLELETFNEVLDTLRQIIEAQEKVNEETKGQQKKNLRDLIE